jgi:hypothetical protein
LLYRCIDETVTRYQQRRTVLMWEISNEATLLADIGNKDRIHDGRRMPTLKDVAGFVDDVAKRIKAADPLRLVNSGGSHMRESQWNLYQRKGWRPDTFEEQRSCFDRWILKRSFSRCSRSRSKASRRSGSVRAEFLAADLGTPRIKSPSGPRKPDLSAMRHMDQTGGALDAPRASRRASRGDLPNWARNTRLNWERDWNPDEKAIAVTA